MVEIQGNEAGVALVVTSVLTFLTVIFNTIFNWIREKRDRRWKIEDEARKNVIHQDIRTNTEITQSVKADAVKAYKEANDLNKKLEVATAVAKEVADRLIRNPADRTRSSDGPGTK